MRIFTLTAACFIQFAICCASLAESVALESAKPAEIGLSQAGLDRITRALTRHVEEGRIAGAVAAISALFSASLSEAVIPTILSSMMSVTARSIPMKPYQATALAMAVVAAMEIKARNSLAFMPSTARCRAAFGLSELVVALSWFPKGTDWFMVLSSMPPTRSGTTCPVAFSSG